MESIISTFHIDWKIIIAQAVNFAVVFVVLYIFALKPLNKLMSERGEKIKRGVSDAKENSILLEQTKKEYEQVLQDAKKEAQKLWEVGKKEAEQKKAFMIEEAQSQVQSLIENGKKTLEAQKAKMVEEAKSELTSLAMLAAEKIMEEKNK